MQQAPVTVSSRLRTTLKQATAVVVGLVLAFGMLLLGVWQFQVFQESGDRAVRERMTAPALNLAEVAPAGSRPGDAYGRTVRFSGHYVPSSQVLVPEAGATDVYRVVTAFVQDNGTAVTVVRGLHRGSPADAPPPPTGHRVQEGVLLPSEPTDSRPMPEGQLSSVRVSVLAQRWEWPLVAGFATLPAELSAEQGLGHAVPEMPREGGEFRNAAYAVQWWVFAAFAVGMGIKMARDFGREREQALIAALDDHDGTVDVPDGAAGARREGATGEQHSTGDTVTTGKQET